MRLEYHYVKTQALMNHYQSMRRGKNWLSVNVTMPEKRDLVVQN